MATLNAVMEEFMRRATIAMHHHHFDDALYNIDKALEMIPGVTPHWTSPFLLLRADCTWHLRKYEQCLQAMHTVCQIGLPVLSPFETKEEYEKWMARGEYLLENGVSLAAGLFDLCKVYCKTPKERARCFVMEGVATCSFFDQRRGLELIRQGERVDRSILEETSNEWKTNGIIEFRRRNYQRSKQLLQRALIVAREDGVHSETRRSILSHLATVHFNLKEYQLALDAGENSFLAKNVPSKDEAERWKERGKTLFKEKNFPLLIKYYSLAIKFTPPEDNFRELRSMLLSNRSIAYNKMRMFQEALADAKECVRINPGWSKGQYRLGSSLLGLGRDQEALTSFCRAFEVADSSDTKDIALQILTVGEKLTDGISRESLSMPEELVQELIKRVTDQKEWKKLHLLFMGGAGRPHHRYGEGGLATGLGCDASYVPLELIVDWGITNNVDFLANFIEELVKCHAPILGSPGCDESPLQIANRRKDITLVEVLSKYDKTLGKHWKDKGLKAFQSKDYKQAISFLTTATRCHLSTQEQRETYEALSEAYYITKDYRKAIDNGIKLYNSRPLESKEISEKWKQRGNSLLGEKKYEIMTGCYTLALNYAPEGDPDMQAAILSNRSMAFLNQNLIAEAKNDANLCILNRRTWFRGYSRLASCFAAENNYEEAVNQYCRGLAAVQADDEKFNLANDLVVLAKKRGTKIPQPISIHIIYRLIKQAVGQKDYETLRYLFIERTCQHRIGSTTHMRTLAHDVEKVFFVPLEMILQSDVKDKERLVIELLAHGASPNGGPTFTITPLQLAIDKRDYRMAFHLLQYGANPSPILERNEWFDPSEGSHIEWLRLARKAKHANSRRAEVFYSLALEYQEVVRNPKVQLEAFQSLSEIHFESRKYDECLRYGYECLKLVPTKSEAEAKKWQARGETLLNRGIFSEVPNYLTLALNYAPPSNKPLRYKLLCRRSFAYNEIDDFQQSVEDGVNATKIQTDDIEGYKCLVSCYKSLGRDSRRLYALNQCLRTEPNPNEKWQYFEEAMDVAVKLPEGATGLTSEVPTSFIEQIQDKAIQSHDWELLRLLYVGGGGPDQLQVGKGGIATKRVRAIRVSIEDAVSANFTSKPETLAALLDHGANVNGLRGNSNPLLLAVVKDQVEVAKVLLEHGANPCIKTDNNQPLLHNVVQKAIDIGHFEMLRCLLSFHNANMESLQDPKGSTLYHLAMNGKVNENKKQVIRLLMDANINPTLKNKTGKRPMECCTSRDHRNKMLSKFVKRYVPTAREEVKEQVNDKTNSHSSLEKEQMGVVNHKVDESLEKVPIAAVPQPQIASLGNASIEDRPIERKPLKSKAQYAEEKKKEVSRKNIEYLIESLTIVKPDDLSHQAIEEEETIEVTEDILRENMEIPENEDGTKAEGEADEEEDGGPETAKNDEEEIDVLDSESLFENLTWEVDCTENVWKTLQSKRVSEKMKRRIVGKIRMLAQGRWSKTTCKRLKGEPERKGILLYESKLTKGGRILWEKTIAFSPRCSNDPTLRLQESVSEDDANSGGDSKATSGGDTGKIYSEIIRVWSIVLDHGDLQHEIENVVKSHERGSHCIVKADLKGFGNKKSGAGNYPSYYMERSKKDSLAGNEETFFPPASSKENEFHILKFYSVTSAVINTLLDGDAKTKIDFPFKVTELEHAIINLKPKPPCPIILLGRSGTGKTTCCLYRLWTEFQNYWEKAATAGPYIPKYIPEQQSSEEEEAAGSCAESSCGVENLQTPVAENQAVDVCNDHAVNEAHIPDEEENGSANTPERCEHFHPLFITKNTVLCSEVQKNFKELRNACPVTKAMTNEPDGSLPNRVEDIGETSWPLFIGARDWLLLLDASLPGTTYFKRAKDGSLLKKIEGWGEEDTHLHFIPEEEEEDDDDDDDEGERERERVVEEGDTKKSKPQAKDVKREATYQVFRDELWLKMNKKLKTDYHPTLVWTEIRSFIKGSVEALETELGFLSLEQYEELGRKRAPNFMGDRSTVYKLFQNYRHNCIRKGLFDEADLVYHLHKRLSENPELPWSIHSVYVDETQDFTQAELSLLIRCCRFQNRMFFTGDTAQSIMRGIAFRFEDLKTLFHGINSFNVTTPDEPVRIPDRLYQLTHNYRSHAGILRLASSVVNLLSYYFPESFDKLEEDRGLFDGPKPVLLESCSLSDLAMILRGNKRHTSRIEFGAHQAVLVVSEEARDNMPEELKHGLVLTIYEAKGLEFDDVLIYNFFKDSHAKKEWRVVTSYIEEMQKETRGGTSGLVELQEKDLKSKTRPLEFQPEKHKVLNSEFKYLYTAITRARVNVWFFDQDEESRSPMFEYFRRLNLVRAIILENEEGTATSLSSMFAESSTKEEWREQGMFFYDKDLWAVAEKCFMFGEDEFMVRKCKAQQQAQGALKHRRSNPRLMKEKFILAATQFLECDMAKEAAVCLYNARERLLLAKLYKKMERFEDAAKYFRLEAHYEEASECMEIVNNYSQAIEIVCEAKLYEKAIEVLERYNSLKMDEMVGFVPPKPNRTIERLCYKLAETHLKGDKREDMERVLERLPSADDRISFLKEHECIEEAARALVDNNRREEAAQFLQLHGRFKAAKRYATDFKFLGDCSLYEARVLSQNKNPEERRDEIVQLLEDAIKYYRRCKDQNSEAEASLFLGCLTDDLELIKECGKMFDQCRNTCGESDVAGERLKRGNIEQFYYRITVRTIERLLDLIHNLHKPYTKLKAKQQGQITVCEQFYGLVSFEDTQIRSCRTSFCERFHLIAPEEVLNKSKNMQVEVDVKDAYQIIAHHLITKAIDLTQKATEFFKSKLELKEDDQSHLVAEMPFHEKFEVLFNWVYLDSVTAKFYNQLKQLGNPPILSKAESMIPKHKQRFLSCKIFTEFLFPETGSKVQHPSAIQISSIRSHKSVKPRLIQFCDDQWKSLETEKGASITDVFLLVSQVMQLLDMRDQRGINAYLNEKERSFEQAIKKDPDNRKLISESGMLPLKGTVPVQFEIFLRHWEVGKKKLHEHWDVVQSLHETLRRFLNYTAKSRSRFYPSIANTLMILEHQLTVSLIMFARLKCQIRHFCCCIPESYLERLKFTDFLNCTRRGMLTTFGAVERHARSCHSFQEQQKCLRSIQRLLSLIVELMFGIASYDFNVFCDTFFDESASDQLIASGVADRTLILSLTLLVNCGKVLYADYEEVILHYIFTVIPHSSLPEHLKTAFQSMSEVSNISDAVEVLKNLLHARNAEKLFDVRWKLSVRDGGLRLDTQTSNPENYNLPFDVSLSEIKEKAKAESSRPVVSGLAMKEQEEDQEDENTAEADSERILEIEKERRNMEAYLQAVINMQRLVRQSQRKKALLKVKKSAEGKDHLDPIEDHLSTFKIDSTACTICGVDFQVTSDEQLEGSKVLNTHANHIASPDHILRQKQFEEYKVLYVSRVAAVLRRVRILYERNVTEIALDMQQLEELKRKLWEKVTQIEYRLEWKDTPQLIPLVESVEEKVRKTEPLVQASSTTDSDEKDEKGNAEGYIEENEDEDLEEILTVKKQKKSQGQRSKERKRRKKGVQN